MKPVFPIQVSWGAGPTVLAHIYTHTHTHTRTYVHTHFLLLHTVPVRACLSASSGGRKCLASPCAGFAHVAPHPGGHCNSQSRAVMGENQRKTFILFNEGSRPAQPALCALSDCIFVIVHVFILLCVSGLWPLLKTSPFPTVLLLCFLGMCARQRNTLWPRKVFNVTWNYNQGKYEAHTYI